MPTNDYLEVRYGGYYVVGSRIGLDVVVYDFRRGRSEEAIFEAYPSIGSLAKVSGDLRTMSVYFQEFVATHESPGVLLIPSSRSIGAAIEGILFVWLNWMPEDLRNRVSWLP